LGELAPQEGDGRSGNWFSCGAKDDACDSVLVGTLYEVTDGADRSTLAHVLDVGQARADSIARVRSGAVQVKILSLARAERGLFPRATRPKAAALGIGLAWASEENEKKGGDGDAYKSEYDYRFHGRGLDFLIRLLFPQNQDSRGAGRRP